MQAARFSNLFETSDPREARKWVRRAGLTGDDVRLVQKGGKVFVQDKGGAADHIADLISERAAIMEYCGGMTRTEAEAAARSEWT